METTLAKCVPNYGRKNGFKNLRDLSMSWHTSLRYKGRTNRIPATPASADYLNYIVFAVTNAEKSNWFLLSLDFTSAN